MTVLETAYQALKQCELTDSQYDFSANWCGMSRSYLSWIKASNSTPSIEVLSKLLFRLLAEEKRILNDRDCMFPEVMAHDAGQLQILSKALEDELERCCLPNSLVDD